MGIFSREVKLMSDFFPRDLSNLFKELTTQYPAVALIGPRQSGKTTLARALFPKLDYVNLEELDNRAFATEDPRGFLSNYSNGAIIDEAQRVPSLFSYLQTTMDETHKPGQFILTGSQHFLLLENISQSLAGRVALLKLLPLSLRELKKEKHELKSVEDLIFTGFYPKLYTNNITPSIWQANYIQTYLERDVRLIKNISDLENFNYF